MSMPSGHREPHRGALILVLGILGLVTGMGFILGPIAWVMGNGDLKKIRAGQMDREGEGMTNAGRICGMIATILAIVSILGCCIVIIVWGLFFAAMAPEIQQQMQKQQELQRQMQKDAMPRDVIPEKLERERDRFDDKEEQSMAPFGIEGFVWAV